MNPEQLWQSVMKELEISLSTANFKTWFKDTSIAEDTGETISVGVPNHFVLDWIRKNFHKNIAESLRRSRPTLRDIRYIVCKPKPSLTLSLPDMKPSYVKTEPKSSPVLTVQRQTLDYTAVEPIQLGNATYQRSSQETGLEERGETDSSLDNTDTQNQVRSKLDRTEYDRMGSEPGRNSATIAQPVNARPWSKPGELAKNAGQAQLLDETGLAASQNQTPLDPNYTFENFIVGGSNRLAHSAAMAAANQPGTKYNPLFFYGGVGLGKTHLAQAIGNQIRKTNPHFIITYVSCEVFINDFIESVRYNRGIDSFKKRYRSSDLLIIDDIQFMSGKEKTQDEFFHTFNALHQAKKQIVLTADKEPQDIPALEERLISRFSWGMVADIQPPDFETRVAILETKAQELGYQIGRSAITTLAELIRSNIRELEGALRRTASLAELENREVTPEFVTKIFESYIERSSHTISSQRIIQLVAEHFEIKQEEVIGSRRYKELVYPRQLIMYLMRHELSYSYPKIGQELGGKDHTTIMHGVEKIEKEIARNSSIQSDLNKIKEKLHNRPGNV
ncbi:MAG: dnaA [Candidatus Berkelbacteria bacterium Gr01-1014_85]|uniref:Chromosomal replication initiator protein DnaA n=1 Tax=Candidatus Berkelbacteria bacterium Gr01-1014_85 TaxID=2017150 RepID=A0A554JDR7_9BACT|nr:MAG: dnaA [Candidatus Berkelbacteria bacterium Gr01-1014_85]